jgi:hypothetical protein
MFVPLFADELQMIITIIVLVVSFLGWLFNQVAGKNQPPQPPRPKPRRAEPRDDIFLRDDEPRRPNQKPSKKKPQQQPRPAEARSARRPGGEIANRHIQTSDLGAGVRSHVTEIQTQKVAQSVQEHMQSRVGQSVSEHLGAFTAATTPQLTKQANQIVQTLRNPASVRQVMIVNMILERPRRRFR